ncbi:MAG: sigma-54 interaction domain-containing protein, partial [Vicinamibacteraceae bacterium]
VQHLALHEAAHCDGAPHERATDAGMPGVRNPRMRALMAQGVRAAQSDATVLITGESGVGKERLAAFIHQHSRRSHGPFIPVNCGALPDTLLENELFGHRRGAFTGAIDDRPGLVEAAHNGTLFLDEVGELLPQTQVKLLRVLQEHDVRRLGDTRSRRVDLRIVAATNRDLAADVRAHRFREDLYYRLNVVSFHIPPLRERTDDLRALIDLLLQQIARTLQRPIAGLTPRALDRLLQYHWPGNVRELENALERACVLATRPHLDLDDLPPTIRRVDTPAMPDDGQLRPLADIEQEYILFVLRQCHGNKTRAARALHICQDTLHRKLKRYRQRELTDSSLTENQRPL